MGGTNPPPAANPSGTPSTAVQDPYAPNAPGQDGIAFVPPPPGAPTNGNASMLKIYVPAENATISMGAGNGDTPGIRMFTDHHIGMWAGAPQTTVSLGTPGPGGVAGIDIYTAAQKREVVALHVEESYQNTKNETVMGALTELYGQTKLETVGGALTEHHQGAKTQVIAGPLSVAVTNPSGYTYASTLSIKSAARTETVTDGGWKADVKGDLKFHATGETSIKGDSDHKWLMLGSDNKFLLGEKIDIIIGVEAKTRIGGVNETILAFKNSVTLGLEAKVGTMTKWTKLIEMEQAAIKKCALALITHTSSLRSADVAVWLNNSVTEVHK